MFLLQKMLYTAQNTILEKQLLPMCTSEMVVGFIQVNATAKIWWSPRKSPAYMTVLE